MKTIQIHLSLFIVLLLLSGITAFPIRSEINYLFAIKTVFPLFMQNWIAQLQSTIAHTPDIMLYGTDWLAFAHIVISLFFIPVLLDPQKHKINLLAGMLACLLILPLAFVCGPVRGIPFFHQLIDCAFGLIGFVYLFFIYKKINQLKNTDHVAHQ